MKLNCERKLPNPRGDSIRLKIYCRHFLKRVR